MPSYLISIFRTLISILVTLLLLFRVSFRNLFFLITSPQQPLRFDRLQNIHPLPTSQSYPGHGKIPGTRFPRAEKGRLSPA